MKYFSTSQEKWSQGDSHTLVCKQFAGAASHLCDYKYFSIARAGLP